MRSLPASIQARMASSPPTSDEGEVTILQIIEKSSTIKPSQNQTLDIVDLESGPTSSRNRPVDLTRKETTSRITSTSPEVVFLSVKPKNPPPAAQIECVYETRTRREPTFQPNLLLPIRSTTYQNSSPPRNRRIRRFDPYSHALHTHKSINQTQIQDNDPPITPAMLKCTICMELASPQTPLCATQCGHMFCEDCLQSSLKHTRKCPNCRKNIPKKNGFHRLFL